VEFALSKGLDRLGHAPKSIDAPHSVIGPNAATSLVFWDHQGLFGSFQFTKLLLVNFRIGQVE
jgi:hypothetical protein